MIHLLELPKPTITSLLIIDFQVKRICANSRDWIVIDILAVKLLWTYSMTFTTHPTWLIISFAFNFHLRTSKTSAQTIPSLTAESPTDSLLAVADGSASATSQSWETKKLLYFEWSPPWHFKTARLDFMSAWLGQVRVDIQLISWNAFCYSQLGRLTGSNLLTFFLTYLQDLLTYLQDLLTYLLTFFLTYLLTFFLTYGHVSSMYRGNLFHRFWPRKLP